jgi:hypothetical protein
MDERDLSLDSFDSLFGRKDLCATEPLPPREEPDVRMFEAVGGEEVKCSHEGCRVRIESRGELVEVGPIARGGERLSIKELQHIGEQVEVPSAFRPAWLDLQYAPRIRPRLLGVRSGEIRPLIFEQTAMEFPFATIGKMFVKRRGQQTMVASGVLVGPRLLLTASHAMPWETDDYSVRFVPAYRNGNDPRFGHAYVDEWRGVRNADDVTGLDYVICRLNWRIGERTGWLGSACSSKESFYYNGDWMSVGYPASSFGGERQAIEVPVGVKDIDDDSDGLEIETRKFALGGWSGGPLFGGVQGQFRVVGIESGFEKDGLDPTRTVFAGGKHMVNLVKYGWANWG